MYIINLAQYIGEKVLGRLYLYYQLFTLSFIVLKNAIDHRTYTAPVINVLIKQIYFTSYQLLPLFLFINIIIGTVINTGLVYAAVEFSLKSQIGNIVVNVIMNEFTPLLVVMLLALRSSTAINTEIAVMKVNNEIKSLEFFNINVYQYLYLPRVLAMIVSTFMLIAIFDIVIIISGYIGLFFFFEIGLDVFLHNIVEVIDLGDIFNYIVKSFLFGLALSIIPIQNGLNATHSLSSVPISVLRGMVNLFLAIMVIEVVLLVIQFI